MRVPKNIRDNLRFLIAEVSSQVETLRDCFETGSMEDAQRILDRSGYAYNLMLRIHEDCHKRVRGSDAAANAARTAGSGATLGSRFEELAELRRQSGSLTDLEIGFCLDTAHCLAAAGATP